MADKQKCYTGCRIRRVWTQSESKALLERYKVRKCEFVHHRKKRLGYAHMLEDLKSAGILTAPTDVDMVEIRIKSMMRAYNTALQQMQQTGKRYPIALWDEMDDVFGDGSGSSPTVSLSQGNPSLLPLLTPKIESDFGFEENSSYSPPKPSISQIFFQSFLKTSKSRKMQDKKEARRNEKFERRLKIREEFEDRREMAREKRFQEILTAIANENKN